jgi:hypothetical protein
MQAPAVSRHAEESLALGMLSVPRILWEGGYLWKFPFNGAGLPKRRWVQIKTVRVMVVVVMVVVVAVGCCCC